METGIITLVCEHGEERYRYRRLQAEDYMHVLDNGTWHKNYGKWVCNKKSEGYRFNTVRIDEDTSSTTRNVPLRLIDEIVSQRRAGF